MSRTEKLIAPGGTRAPKPKPPGRLTEAVEQSIREMIARPGFHAPTIALLMREVDWWRAGAMRLQETIQGLRIERDEARARLAQRHTVVGPQDLVLAEDDHRG